jgi:hypothetical protein
MLQPPNQRSLDEFDTRYSALVVEPRTLLQEAFWLLMINVKA